MDRSTDAANTPSPLDDIHIATPCSADWADMAGDERVRHCGSCRLNVYNLSEMTRAEAESLVRSREGRVCVRMYRRTDGTLVTQDCWARLRAARRRGWLAFAAALVLVGAAQLGVRLAALGWLLEWSAKRTPPAIATPVTSPPALPIVAAPPPAPPIVAPPPDVVEHVMGEMAYVPPPPTPKKKSAKSKPSAPF